MNNFEGSEKDDGHAIYGRKLCRFYSAWIDLKTYKQCRQLQWDHQSPILVGTNWVLKSLAQLGQYLLSLPRLNNFLHYFATPLVSPFSTERLVYLLIWTVPTNRNPIHRLELTQSAIAIWCWVTRRNMTQLQTW